MPRRLLAINALLVVVSASCVGLIVKQLAAARPAAALRPRPAATPPAPTPPAETGKPPAQAYSVVATRNLFSPTRSETPGTGVAGGPAIPIVKPSLHGVVLRDGSPIAYLEDPMTKRIAGYRIGDPIAGGTVQTISADSVIIARPDGAVDVRLRDPAKPRPLPPAPAQPGAPGQPPVPGQVPGPQPLPGVVPPRAFVPPAQPAPQPAPGLQTPAPSPGLPSPFPFQRPAPSMGRRLPPGVADQATPPPSAPQQ